MYLNNRDLYVEIIVSKATGKLTRKAEKMMEILEFYYDGATLEKMY